MAIHYKTLAFDVTFLTIAMALAPCVVYFVKIIVDSGAQEEEQEQRDADSAAAEQAAVDRTRARNASKEASAAEEDAVQAEADAERAVKEKRAAYYEALKVFNQARSQANQAEKAAQAADADLTQAKANPAGDDIATQNKIADLEVAAEEAVKAAAQAEEEAAKADKDLDVINNELKEARDEVKQKVIATRAAKRSAAAAKKTAAAAEPKTGIARFPLWKRLTLRVLFMFATAVSLYSCVIATLSFRELLEYKTGCVRFEGDSDGRRKTGNALSVFEYMLFGAFGSLHLMILVGACVKD